jgi:hypothetical protein
VTYSTTVSVTCHCGDDTSSKTGTRIITKEFLSSNDYFVARNTAEGPLDIDIPGNIWSALGDLIADQVSNLPGTEWVTSDTLNLITGRIIDGRPSAVTDGDWKNGISPCGH